MELFFPSAFLALALAHFVALLSPGPDFFLLVGYAARYLLWIGSHLIRSRQQALALNETHQRFPSLQKQILLGLGSALLNPKNALFYLALMTALLGPDVTLLQQSICGVWMVVVVLVWDLALVSLMGLSAVQQKLSRSLWWIERTAGVVLMGFGGWVLWRLLENIR
ncbi:TPA: LysE family transporter [Enterobacter asburiae]|uniref:LysE family translocator n=1 Tax=Enterobacter asburiae TaxID=61645 RepID=UPI000738B286|nr:LysE family transporter [Enterobacter asburiae]MBT2100027.1 LysE family transporter [Enterobacter asburiae]MDX7663336.1 LysE family transporter [Enterobacter asburiae]HCR2013736.1 LysE family transporter [Enterobacter asburiae]HCR2021114.1 LysE family transporter [Enterobacter asburiae]HCR2023242.1 LysE family transporter [Enterobacter asburiae]